MKISFLKKLIAEYYAVALKVNQFNKLFTKPLGAFYLGMTISIDISVFIAIFGYNPLVRFLCANLALMLFTIGNIIIFMLASVLTKAHWSYPCLNSLIASKSIPLRFKFKVIFSNC